jgi:hypothetical protein
VTPLIVAVGATVVGLVATVIGAHPDIIEIGWSFAAVSFGALLLTSVVPLWRPTRLTLPAIWFYTFVGLIVVGGHFVTYDMRAPASEARFLMGVRIAVVLTAFGAWLSCRLAGVDPSAVDRHYREETRTSDLGPFFPLLFAGLATVALLLFANYLRETPNIPLISLVLGRSPSATLLIVARAESFTRLDSQFVYAYSLLRVLGFPFLIAVSFVMYRRTRERGWLGAFLLVLAVGLFFAGASLARFPVGSLFLVLFGTIYLDNAGRISPRLLATAVTLFLAFPVFVVFGLAWGTLSPIGALGAIARRITYDPALTTFHYFDLVPTYIDHLGGRTIADLSRLMGWAPFDIENYVGLIGEGARFTFANANAAYIANFYADWALPGVAIGSLLTGVMLGAGQALVIRLPRTPVTMAMTSHLFFCTLLLAMTSLPTTLMSNGAILILALPFVLRHLEILVEGVVRTYGPRRSTA